MFVQFLVSTVQFKLLKQTHWRYEHVEEALMFVPTVWWMYELCWRTKYLFYFEGPKIYFILKVFVRQSKTTSYQTESDAGVQCVWWSCCSPLITHVIVFSKVFFKWKYFTHLNMQKKHLLHVCVKPFLVHSWR